jgi:hypothetical protein
LELSPEQLAQLVRSESLELGPYELRLKTQPDSDIGVNDFDCYGFVQWSHGTERPPGFDGSAEVLQRDRGSRLWWQPYRDGSEVCNSARDRRLVADIVEYGFQSLGLELWGPAVDVLGTEHLVELGSAWVGGVEPFADSHHVTELVDELLCDIAAQLAAPLPEGQ